MLFRSTSPVCETSCPSMARMVSPTRMPHFRAGLSAPVRASTSASPTTSTPSVNILIPNGVPQTATLVKYIRAAVIDELSTAYVRTAKGKGVPFTMILFGHVLKNAIVAIVPLIGMMIGEIFSGSIIIEQVFGIPGVGRLLVSSVLSRDFPLTQTLVVYVALLIVITNFIVDLVIQFLDPRIRLMEEQA